MRRVLVLIGGLRRIERDDSNPLPLTFGELWLPVKRSRQAIRGRRGAL